MTYGLARFAAGLWKYVREPITLGDAERTIRRGVPAGPIDSCPCWSDLSTRIRPARTVSYWPCPAVSLAMFAISVRRDGVDGTLEKLYRAGLYLSFEESRVRPRRLKAARPLCFAIQILIVRWFERLCEWYRRSNGRPTRIKVDLDFVAEMAPHWAVWFDVHGVFREPFVLVQPISPGFNGASPHRAPIR